MYVNKADGSGLVICCVDSVDIQTSSPAAIMQFILLVQGTKYFPYFPIAVLILYGTKHGAVVQNLAAEFIFI